MAGSYDGSLKFDTAIDEKGFNSGITKLGGLCKRRIKSGCGCSCRCGGLRLGAVTKASLDSVASLEQNVGGVKALFRGCCSNSN